MKFNVKELIDQGCDISDGYHTFNELYEFRKLYNAALFNQHWDTRISHCICKICYKKAVEELKNF